MTEFNKAIKIVLENSFVVGKESVAFTYSLNRILAEDVISDIDIPPFDKATVDGYACRKQDIFNDLEITETIAAGKMPEYPVTENRCARIMTGAAIPEGADTIFMVEYSEILASGKVRFNGNGTKENISFKGEDVVEGDCVLKSGRLIRPQDIAVMALAGKTTVKVMKMPIVAVISSGDELVEPSEKPGFASIRNSNAYQLMAQIQRAGALASYMGIAGDNKETTYEMLTAAMKESDIVIITGGVSKGDFDFVPDVFEKAGVNILFAGVNVQPGKPVIFGVHPDALVFGLPGNPVSAFVQFELMVRPLICKIMNYNWIPSVIKLPLNKTVSRRSTDRHSWIPVFITDKMKVSEVEYHGSAHISAFTEADGLIVIPAGKKSIEKGELVDVRRI